MSSGDQGSVKYGCTEELEDALSSVNPMSNVNKNQMQFTGSEDLEDMVKGYLKSGRLLESKLQKMNSLKGAKSIDKMGPGKSGMSLTPIKAAVDDGGIDGELSLDFQNKDIEGGGGL